MRTPGREGAGAPPAPSGTSGRLTPPPSPRRVAFLALSLSAAGLLALVLEGAERRALAARYRPPFGAEAAEAVRPDGSAWRAGDLRRPTVLLYVVWSCGHCGAELRRWADVVAEGRADPSVDLRVVAPAPPPEGALPSALVGRLLLDRDGATARALGARVVPTTAYLTPGGRVVALTRGRSAAAGVRRSLERLREGGGHGSGP